MSNFHRFEVVCRGSETQHQVGEKFKSANLTRALKVGPALSQHMTNEMPKSCLSSQLHVANS